ncbi:nicotinate-nucleotide adenylyltransferase [Geobacter pelophilus]|uniref:Probable nicotinate-nucleotide adenylyltransferase n=1 Tax=Geoanaerobacter pelophilus TaxID=60036 RepID=A0AAW4L7J5_9BACT|nr:nicotinate-nucleotide adenylyltransferase [Geoanaerobacter pelophilus]MBT0663772.1 nicotinate-nucleotide adenylyltransferase [Geoanaerobacter pelophilus]
MRIGILGGTFNPIHLAHLRIAEEVRENLALDRITFIPAASPPHKPMNGELPFELRCELVRVAIADNESFQLSRIEGERAGKSYSIDTLRALGEQRPADELFFIIGSDSFLEFGTWHEYRAIFQCSSIVVVERPGARVPNLSEALPEEVRSEFVLDRAANRLDHRSGHQVHYLGECLLDISSTRIRNLARQGRSIRYLVPAAVERYIIEQGLYADER